MIQWQWWWASGSKGLVTDTCARSRCRPIKENAAPFVCAHAQHVPASMLGAGVGHLYGKGSKKQLPFGFIISIDFILKKCSG